MDKSSKTLLFIMLALVAGILIGVYLMPSDRDRLVRESTSSPYTYGKMDEVMSLIRSYYFEKTDEDSLTDEAVAALLNSLDPHSSYVSRKDAEDYNSVLYGSFEGIGISFNMLNDTILIISVNAGGPSWKAGLQPGDKIVGVDSSTVAGVKIKNNDVIRMLRGKKGSKVRVQVRRSGVEEILSFDIIRDKIPIHSIEVSYMIRPKVGYIQINSFSATTADEFREALHRLSAKGMEKLVLDLRGNSGGSLRSAVEICDEFLPRHSMIVYTKGKSMRPQYFRATSLGSFQEENQQLVVLVDEWSASASEIVAGAVQDQDRGTIVGRRTFGKGLVQRSFTLADSSEVLLTVARYYTPTGRCIQKPFEHYDDDIVQRYLRGEMNHPDSIRRIDSLKFKTPKGKIVYGGGGIVPDVFVPVDTSEDYVYFNRLSQSGIVFQYAMAYTDQHRKSLNAYAGVEAFDAGFSVTDEMLKEMIRKGEAAGISSKEAGPGSLKVVRKWCKAYIARNLFGETGFYYISNQDDKMLAKAIQILSK